MKPNLRQNWIIFCAEWGSISPQNQIICLSFWCAWMSKVRIQWNEEVKGHSDNGQSFFIVSVDALVSRKRDSPVRVCSGDWPALCPRCCVFLSFPRSCCITTKHQRKTRPQNTHHRIHTGIWKRDIGQKHQVIPWGWRASVERGWQKPKGLVDHWSCWASNHARRKPIRTLQFQLGVARSLREGETQVCSFWTFFWARAVTVVLVVTSHLSPFETQHPSWIYAQTPSDDNCFIILKAAKLEVKAIKTGQNTERHPIFWFSFNSSASNHSLWE